MVKYTREDLACSIAKLGVMPGDTLIVRADLGAIGPVKSRDRNDYIGAFLDAVGPEGTLIGLAFTGCTSSVRALNMTAVFDGSNPTYTGSFANLMLSHPSSYRSSHPSNSYVGIGKHARGMLAKHDETQGAYEPVRDVIALDGKMLLVGCAGSSPGFTTTHLAEVDLGLHKRIIFPRRYRSRYLKNGEVRIFRRPDLGSCSPSFYRMYGFYAKAQILRQGFVGNAYSLMVDAKEAYEIDRAVLQINPRITICGRPDCRFCNTMRWDNLLHMPLYLVSFYGSLAKRRIKNLLFRR